MPLLLLLVLEVLAVTADQQRFTRQPVDVVARLGDTVELECGVEEPAAMQWTRDQFGLGQHRGLPGFPRLAMVGGDPGRDWNLRILAAQIDDEGEYQCQVVAGSATPALRSSSARLLVAIPSGPPHILSGGEVELRAGERTTMECSARGGRPAVSLDWQLGHITVVDMEDRVEKIEGSVTFLTTSVVHVMAQREDDGMEVRCRASGPGQEVGVASAALRVTYKPEVKLRLVGGSGGVEEGSSMTAECLVAARPPATSLTWTLDEEVVEGETSSLLVVPRVRGSHHGARLACSATNPLGSGHASTTLTVIYGPTMVRSPAAVEGTLGSTVTLECLARGHPAPSYTWHSSAAPGLVGTGPSLELTLTPTSPATYTCTAHGAAGSQAVSAGAEVGLIRAPSLALTDMVMGEEGKEVSLVCSMKGEQEKVVLGWSRKGEVVVSSDGCTVETVVGRDRMEAHLTILHMEPHQFGVYTCTASWAGGTVEAQVEVVEASAAELVVIQVVLTSLGLLSGLLCLVAALRLGRGVRRGLQAEEGQEKSAIYEELDILQPEPFYQPMLEKEEKTEDTPEVAFMEGKSDPVLESMNRDYAAYYGNPHLSCHLTKDK